MTLVHKYPPVFAIAADGKVTMEGNRDVLQHLMQADYSSLAAVALQRLKRQSKTATAWFCCSRLLILSKPASLVWEDGVLETHHCSQTATASCKKDSHAWNSVRNLPWAVLTETHNTLPWPVCSLLISHVRRSLVYSTDMPKVLLMWMQLYWLLSNFLHLSEATSSTGRAAVLQRHEVVTLKPDEEGRDTNINVNHTKLTIPSYRGNLVFTCYVIFVVLDQS